MKQDFLIITMLTAAIASSCGIFGTHQPSKDWAYLDQWDKNSNERLNLDEFVGGYHEAGFFKRWNEKSRPISDSTFLQRIFVVLDTDKNLSLDSTEYNSRRVLWAFPGTMKLKEWDENHNNILERDEFLQKAGSEKLALYFDLSADGLITEEEMAQAMFVVCDKDHDDKVSGMEFYLWEMYRR